MSLTLRTTSGETLTTLVKNFVEISELFVRFCSVPPSTLAEMIWLATLSCFLTSDDTNSFAFRYTAKLIGRVDCGKSENKVVEDCKHACI